MTNTVSTHKTGGRRVGYIVAIIFNIIALYVFNNLMNWGVPFLTSRYSGVLWAIDLSLGASIIANVLFLVFDYPWMRHLGQLILIPLSTLALFIIWAIFPFTFSAESWAFWVKVSLIIIMVFSAIGFIVEFFKLILGKE